MAVLIWLRFVFLFGFSHCYINLSRKPTTTVTQSSTYTGSIFHNASLATDGTRKTKEEFCSHTDVNHTKAWFQVDLGGLYSIKSVQIFYRKEGDGESDWKQYRFRQFYLEVSQAPANTTTAQRIRCYKDNTTAPDLPENIINITCVQTARYVIVETTYEAKEDDENNVYGAILEICEIEVYGCAVGEYGAECEPCLGCSTCDIEHGCRCSEHCKNNSCNDSRVCIQGCNSGYWGQTCEADCSSYCVNNTCLSDGRCTEMCEAGDWGHNCSSQCPQNCNQPTCSRDNGHCASCKPNWIGDQCNRCDSTHYGTDCSLACSINCTGNICNKKGYCTDGCKMGTYGDMCQKQCSTCNANCDRITGQCIGECPTGKFGTYCEEMCDQLCSNGCMKSNGVCNSCDDKKYGDYCNKTCSPQCQSACDQQSGSCECLSGWTGTACNGRTGFPSTG